MQISILGAGAWGSALAVAFSKVANIILWSKDEKQVEQINITRNNINYLPADVVFSKEILITNDIKDTLSSNLLIIATPINALREVLSTIYKQINNKDIIWVCKGFEAKTGLLPHQIIYEVCGDIENIGALLGPSFALEVAKGLPTAVSLASKSRFFVNRWIDFFNSVPNFRVYANEDVVGCEVGAGVKNIMAIAVGLSDGLNLGFNARAALITRGLNELAQLVIALGGSAKTIYGLTGVGDLILTCTGDLSRNRLVGLKLAQGEAITDIVNNLGHVSEGVNAIEVVRKLSYKLKIDMPIVEAVYRITFEGADLTSEVYSLFKREPKFEIFMD